MREFEYDRCFTERATQAEIFDTCACPVIDQLFSGYNGSIIAYGQTGTGKTYTMGLLESTEDLVSSNLSPIEKTSYDRYGQNSRHKENILRRQTVRQKGIIPQSIFRVFEKAKKIKASINRMEITVKMSFLQVYLDSVFDLFCEAGSAQSMRSLKVREGDAGFYADGLAEFEVESFTESIELLEWGLQNRVFSSTFMNFTSSRSHTVLFLRVYQKSPIESKSHRGGDEGKRNKRWHHIHGTLALVDLAGSERVRRTGSTGTALNEAKSINSSLSALGNVVAALADESRLHIPYRDHKLTKILQDCIGGAANTVFIATIGPSAWDYNETLSTLNFASRCRNIQAAPIQNRIEDEDQSMIIETLKAKLLSATNEVERLQIQVQQWQGSALALQEKCKAQEKELNDKNKKLEQQTFSTTLDPHNVRITQENIEDKTHITRPTKRLLGQMFKFYSSILTSLQTTIVKLLRDSDDGVNSIPNTFSMNQIFVDVWTSLYFDESSLGDIDFSKDSINQMHLVDSNESIYSIAKQKVESILQKHRQTFPRLQTHSNEWKWDTSSNGLFWI